MESFIRSASRLRVWARVTRVGVREGGVDRRYRQAPIVQIDGGCQGAEMGLCSCVCGVPVPPTGFLTGVS